MNKRLKRMIVNYRNLMTDVQNLVPYKFKQDDITILDYTLLNNQVKSITYKVVASHAWVLSLLNDNGDVDIKHHSIVLS